MISIYLLIYQYTRLLYAPREVNKTTQTRGHEDITLPSPPAPCLLVGVNRGGASQTLHSVPIVIFYQPQE